MITLSIGHLLSSTEFLKWAWLLWNVQKNAWHYLKCYKALHDKGTTFWKILAAFIQPWEWMKFILVYCNRICHEFDEKMVLKLFYFPWMIIHVVSLACEDHWYFLALVTYGGSTNSVIIRWYLSSLGHHKMKSADAISCWYEDFLCIVILFYSYKYIIST